MHPLEIDGSFVGLVNVGEIFPQDVTFSNDGTRMFVVGTGNGSRLHEYTLPVPFDVSTRAENEHGVTVSNLVLATDTTSIPEVAIPRRHRILK